jgi:hypothetical protein
MSSFETSSKPTKTDPLESVQLNVRDNILIPDAQYKWHRDAIEQMPPKKRKHYRGCLIDKWGQRSKVRYDPKTNTLLNYSLIAKEFVPIMPMSIVHIYESKAITPCGILAANGVDDPAAIFAELNHTGNHVPRDERRTVLATNPYGHD